MLCFDWKNLTQILNILNLKLVTEWEFLSIRKFLVNVTLKIGQEKYLLPVLFWKQIFELKKLKI